MGRFRKLVVVGTTAAMLLPAAPAKAYHPAPALAMRHVVISQTTLLLVVIRLSYSTSPPNRTLGTQPTEDCATGAPVRIERKKDDGWKVVARGRTNDNAKLKKRLPDRKGKYRAHILAYTTDDNNECFEGYSVVKRHTH